LLVLVDKGEFVSWEKNFMRAGKVFETLSKPFATIELDAKPFDDEPILMAANHRSLLDVFVALICCYRLGRPTRFIVGRVFFKRPGLGQFLRAIGCIEGGKGSGADKVAIAAIQSGTTCAIMPEGKIANMEPGKILGPLMPGVSEIWAQTGCAFHAVGISGAQQIWKAGKNLPHRPHLRLANRPVVHVRVTEAIREPKEQSTLDRVAQIMEDNCVASEADRVAKLALR
jgi:1-acyl-sn-glycerol-3-phosphate acyltransferase